MSGVDVSALLEQKLEEDRLEEKKALTAKKAEDNDEEEELQQRGKRKIEDDNDRDSSNDEPIEQVITTASGIEIKKKGSRKSKKKKKKKKKRGGSYEEDDEEEEGSSRSRRRRGDDDDVYGSSGRDRYGRDRRDSGSSRYRSKRRRRSRSRESRRSHRSSRSSRRRRRSPSPSRESRRKRDGAKDDASDKGTFKSVVDAPEELDLRNRIRDQCTVMVAQLPPKSTSQEVADFFTSCGRVRDVKLIKARRRDRIHKGIGYVEFDSAEQAAVALNMVGVPFQGRVLVIQPTQNEKNRAGSVRNEVKKQQHDEHCKDATRVYVGSLHFDVTEPILTSLFTTIGPVTNVNLITDETGKSRGFGFVSFADVRYKDKAIRELNGTELMGRHIKVNAVGVDSSAVVKAAMGELDEQVEGNDDSLTLTKQNRANLMARLGGHEPVAPGAMVEQAAAQLHTQNVTVTRCIVFENMFNAEQEDAMDDNDNWETEILDDVKAECARFGVVEHAALARERGSIYCKFSKVSDAGKAFKELNGRHFGGNTVVGLYISPTVYDRKFDL